MLWDDWCEKIGCCCCCCWPIFRVWKNVPWEKRTLLCAVQLVCGNIIEFHVNGCQCRRIFFSAYGHFLGLWVVFHAALIILQFTSNIANKSKMVSWEIMFFLCFFLPFFPIQSTFIPILFASFPTQFIPCPHYLTFFPCACMSYDTATWQKLLCWLQSKATTKHTQQCSVTASHSVGTSTCTQHLYTRYTALLLEWPCIWNHCLNFKRWFQINSLLTVAV